MSKLVFDFYKLEVCLHTKQQASKILGPIFGTSLPNMGPQR